MSFSGICAENASGFMIYTWWMDVYSGGAIESLALIVEFEIIRDMCMTVYANTKDMSFFG